MSALCCLGQSWFALVLSLLGSSASLTCNVWKAVRNCLRHPADIPPPCTQGHGWCWWVKPSPGQEGDSRPSPADECCKVQSVSSCCGLYFAFFAVWNGQRINAACPTVSVLSPSACPGGLGGPQPMETPESNHLGFNSLPVCSHSKTHSGWVSLKQLTL